MSNQRRLLRHVFDEIRSGGGLFNLTAAAMAAALLAPAVMMKNDEDFAQAEEGMLASLATKAIIHHWHNPDPQVREQFIGDYADGYFSFTAEQIRDYAERHFHLLWPAQVDTQTIIDGYATQAILNAQDRFDLVQVREELEALMGTAAPVTADAVMSRVEDLNGDRQKHLRDLAIRGMVRHFHGLGQDITSRDQLRELMRQDGTKNELRGIRVDDVIDYMADHLGDLSSHEIFAHLSEDEARMAQAMKILRGSDGPAPAPGMAA